MDNFLQIYRRTAQQLLFSVVFLCLSGILFAQDQIPFTGYLEYKISIRDTAMRSLFPDNKLCIYTNDTITRIENFDTPVGDQVIIHHLQLNKSYMLLDMPQGKFAVRTNHAVPDSTKKVSRYVFSKKRGKRKVLGMKVKKVYVTHPDFQQKEEFLYLKQYSNKYLNNLENSPGLLVKFSLSFPDGILDYELVKMETYVPNRDLFGIPDDYEKMDLDTFIQRVIPKEPTIPGEN